jgi:small multidrug resistance pump
MAYLFLIGAFICNAGANILLKLATLKQFSFGGALKGDWNLGTLYAGLAIALFGLNLLLYLAALAKIPLSIGYPIMVGMTFLITIGASIFLGEKISLVHAVGMALILGGVFLIVRFAQV